MVIHAGMAEIRGRSQVATVIVKGTLVQRRNGQKYRLHRKPPRIDEHHIRLARWLPLVALYGSVFVRSGECATAQPASGEKRIPQKLTRPDGEIRAGRLIGAGDRGGVSADRG